MCERKTGWLTYNLLKVKVNIVGQITKTKKYIRMK